MDSARRGVVKGLGLGLLAVEVAGAPLLLSPADAKARGAAFKALTAPEAAALEAFGEALAPGARAAGIAHFVDAHLAVDPEQSLLMIRYLDIPPPWLPFYRAGLAALDGLATARHRRGFAGLDAGQAAALTGELAQAVPPGWRGPPSPLFYFAVRADAVDVVWGTEAGFAALGVPYMAHIAPDPTW